AKMSCTRHTSRFFLQAEDGIRDRNVTGVQTCALPILPTDNAEERWGHYHLVSSTSSTTEDGDFSMEVQMEREGEVITRSATGNGPISALVAMFREAGVDVRVLDYTEHALTEGGEAMAAAYVEAAIGDRVLWGIGLDHNTSTASLQA